MLLHDANDTWADYKEYIVSLFLNNFISDKDYDLSLEHGKLFKDGKPYTKEKDLSFESVHELNYKPRSFENKLLDEQYESLDRHYRRIMDEFKNYQKSKTMESVKVTPPEGYEIDQEKSTTSEIFFRKKDGRVKNWKDMKFISGYFISSDSKVYTYNNTIENGSEMFEDKNVWPTKELAEAALALSELMQYRHRWIGDWEPNWVDGETRKYCIVNHNNNLRTDWYTSTFFVLSFPTPEMRDDFLNSFKDLLEKAKPLL